MSTAPTLDELRTVADQTSNTLRDLEDQFASLPARISKATTDGRIDDLARLMAEGPVLEHKIEVASEEHRQAQIAAVLFDLRRSQAEMDGWAAQVADHQAASLVYNRRADVIQVERVQPISHRIQKLLAEHQRLNAWGAA